MIKLDVKVDTTAMNQSLMRVQRALSSLPQDTLDEFRKNTPKRTGNARRKTKLNGHTIEADYPYAQRLEDNWSKQTKGQGIIKPTLKWLRNRVRQIARMK